MTRTDIKTLDDTARAWVFGISPSLDDRDTSTLLERVDVFLDQWSAHGTPILAGREVRDRSFLVVAVDKRAETSGCSIDRLFGTLKQLERDLRVSILDATRVFLRHGDGRVDAVSRPEFRDSGDKHTIVFDTTAERLGDIRNGAWERHAEDSWHKDLLGTAAIPV